MFAALLCITPVRAQVPKASGHGLKQNTAHTGPTGSVHIPTHYSVESSVPSIVLCAPVAEQKLYKLLKGYSSSDEFGASAVHYRNGYFYIACDNMQKIAKIKSTLPVNSNQNSLLSTGTPGSGTSNYEGITYDDHGTPNWYVVAETEPNGSVYQPRIYQFDSAFNYQDRTWADYNFVYADRNKAFEGLAWVYRGGDNYLLGMVEGTGKIVVVKKTSVDWTYVTEMTLPGGVTFDDYSDLTLYGNKIAITSQVDAAIWIGTLSETSWSLSGGTVYMLPTGNESGVVGAGTLQIYGNIEGISFITDHQIVLVSDMAHADQPTYQQIKDQSVHIFNIPE